MKMRARMYDFVKAVAQIWLPALGTLYFALVGIWGLPSAEQVLGTIVSVDTFLGVILGISAANFSSKSVGTIVTKRKASGGKTFTLELDGDLDDLDQHDEVRFRVSKQYQQLKAVEPNYSA